MLHCGALIIWLEFRPEGFWYCSEQTDIALHDHGGGPGVVVSIAVFYARDRVSFPGLGGLKETKMFLPHPLVKLSIVGSLLTEK